MFARTINALVTRTNTAKWLLASAAAVAFAGPAVAQAAPFAGQGHRDRDDHRGSERRYDGDRRHEERYGDRHDGRHEDDYGDRRGGDRCRREERVWVPPVYRTVCDRVWIEPVYRTECEQVWVPDRWEYREVSYRHRGRWCTRTERVLIEPGHYESRDRRVCVREGYWKTVERQELVRAGHYEYRHEAKSYRRNHNPVGVISPGLYGRL